MISNPSGVVRRSKGRDEGFESVDYVPFSGFFQLSDLRKEIKWTKSCANRLYFNLSSIWLINIVVFSCHESNYLYLTPQTFKRLFSGRSVACDFVNLAEKASSLTR